MKPVDSIPSHQSKTSPQENTKKPERKSSFSNPLPSDSIQKISNNNNQIVTNNNNQIVTNNDSEKQIQILTITTAKPFKATNNTFKFFGVENKTIPKEMQPNSSSDQAEIATAPKTTMPDSDKSIKTNKKDKPTLPAKPCNLIRSNNTTPNQSPSIKSTDQLAQLTQNNDAQPKEMQPNSSSDQAEIATSPKTIMQDSGKSIRTNLKAPIAPNPSDLNKENVTHNVVTTDTTEPNQSPPKKSTDQLAELNQNNEVSNLQDKEEIKKIKTEDVIAKWKRFTRIQKYSKVVHTRTDLFNNQPNPQGVHTRTVLFENEKERVIKSEKFYYHSNRLIGFQASKEEQFALKDKNTVSGSSKWLSQKNDTSVTLTIKNPAEKTIEKSNQEHPFSIINKNNRVRFKDTRAIYPTYYISENKAMAKNAGTDLYTCIGEGKNITVQHFKDALNDLKSLHGKGINVIDLKPENLSFTGNKVVFIDTDGFLDQTQKQIKETTFEYITSSLLLDEESSNKADVGTPETKQMNRNKIDAFAMLLTMIESTEDEFFLEFENEHYPGLRTFGLCQKHRDLVIEDEDGNEIETKEEKSELERASQWVNKHIIKSKREEIISFLKSPSSSKEAPEIYDVIDWKAIEE